MSGFVLKSVTMTFLYDKIEETNFRNLKAEFTVGKQHCVCSFNIQ